MRTTLTALGTCLVLGLAACAGGDDGEAATEFRAQANAICADYGPKIAVLAPPLEDVDEWAAIAADKADLLEAAVNGLRQLEPPDDLAESFGAWVTLKADALATTRELQNAGGLHDQEGVDAALAALEATEAEADPAAEELELEDCAGGDW